MTKLFFSSLRGRLAAVALLALFPVLLLTVYLGWRQYQSDREAVEAHLLHAACHFGIEQRDLLERTRHLLTAMTQAECVRTLNEESCQRFVTEELRLRTSYRNLGVADAAGRVIASAVSGLTSVAHEPWFERAVAQRDFVALGYVPHPLLGEAILTAAQPLRDEQGVVRAVTFAMMDLSWLAQIVPMLDLPEGSSVLVFDKRGKTLLVYGVEESAGLPVEPRLREAVVSGLPGGAIHSKKWLYGVSPLSVGVKKHSVFVAVAIPARLALRRPYENLLHGAMVWLLGLLLMMLCLNRAGYRFFVRPIESVIAATKRLASGDLSVRVSRAGGGRELRELAQAFNDMATALATQAAQLEQSEERFRRVIETTPLAIQFWRLQPDGRLVLTGANRMADEMLGLRHESLVGKTLREALPWLAHTEVADRYREVCVLGVPWRGEQEWYSGDKLASIFEVFAFRTVAGSMAVKFSDVTEQRRAIQALRESEQRFRQLFESSPDSILVVTVEGRVLEVNPAAGRLYGLPREALVGRPIGDLVAPERREDWERDFSRVAKGELTHFNAYGYTSSRTEVPLEVTAAPIHYAAQDAVLLLVRDISARRRAEQALAESETRYRVLAEAAFEGIVITDTGRIVDANSRFVEMLGYSLTELIGKPFNDLVAEESPNAPLEGDSRGRGGPVEFLLRRKNGPLVRVQAHSRIIPYKGRSMCVVALRDVTEEHRALETMQRLATAIEQTAEAVMITDADGRITYVNPAFEAITGYRVAEVVGQNPRILKSGKHDASFYRELWDTLRRGEVWHGFFVNRKKDGTIYQEEATISPIKDAQGRITSYVAVKRDVTREIALQLQLLQTAKMEAIGRLAGGMAHDFNNRLVAIIGYGELCLRRLPEDDPLRHYIEELLKSAERARSLTSQLLALSRKQVFEAKVFDLNELLLNNQDMLRRVIGEDVELLIAPSPTPLWPVKADPRQIEQVLLNLVLNARDAMPLGGHITIAAANVFVDESLAGQHPDLKPGRYVRLSVSDTGIGMTDEVKAHLFEPFFTTKKGAHGTGLGLATSYAIVKQSGGHITVASAPNQGTTFHIYLPRADTEVPNSVELTPPKQAPPSRGHETVLLAEDDASVREFVGVVLQELGYKVLSAENGVRALQLLEEHPGLQVDLLLTDVVMPLMGGRELADRLRQVYPRLKVLFITGYSTEAEAISRSLSPTTFYLPKPFSGTVLAHKVRSVLDA